MTSNYSFVNNSLVETQKATISIADRGFRFGDGVFETIRLVSGVPYLWEYHIKRLLSGLQLLLISPPQTDIKSATKQLINKNNAQNGYIRITVSRGVGSLGYLPTAEHSTLIVECIAEAFHDVSMTPAASLCVSDYRRISAHHYPSEIKVTHGVTSTLALMSAHQQGFDNALLLSNAGHISECANANIFWILDHNIYTPSLDTGCINGVTRQRIMELSSKPIREVSESLDTLYRAQSVLISNTRMGACGVKRIMHKTFNSHAYFDAIIHALKEDYAHYHFSHHTLWVE